MLKRTIAAALLAVALGLAQPQVAFAHGAKAGPNGGLVFDAEAHHVELVATADTVTIYLTDESQAAVSTQGAAMQAIVMSGGKSAHIDLMATEPNKLSGALAAPLGSGDKVVVTGALPGVGTLQARFVVP